MEKKLSQLSIGKSAIIKRFDDDELLLKLFEMGCYPGEKVTLENIAPLGDPISIKVFGYLLSLRIGEADKIIVEQIEN